MIVGYIRARPGGDSGSLGSFQRAMGVVGFFRVHWVHSGVPWGSSSSFRFIGFICSAPGCRWVHSGATCVSIGSFGPRLGMVGFICVRWVHSGESLGSLCSFVCALGADEFIWARPWGRRVHFGSFQRALAVVCSFVRALVVVGFIRVRNILSGALLGSWCAFGMVAYIRARPWSGRVK